MSQTLVLCATDLTDEGTRAVDMALATARAVKGELVLVHTCDPIPESEEIPASMAPGIDALRERLLERREVAQKKMDAERARCIATGVATEVVLVDGPPAEGILSVAQDRHPALIVLGRRHRHEGFVGKTIDQVVRHAACPVFVAPPDGSAPKDLSQGNWLVGVDFSPHCLHAIHATRAFVEHCGGKMRLMHVVSPAGGEGRPYDERSPAQLLREEGLREEETKLRELAKAAAPEAQVEQLRTIERPSDELCRVADEMDATAIVVGTHGRSGVARLFLGSTAERLLRHAKRPVLVVRESPESASSWYEDPNVVTSHLGPNRLLVAIDFSAPARRALELARSLGAKLHVAVEVVHVHDTPHDIQKGLASAVTGEASAAPPRATDDTHAVLEKHLAELVRDVFGPDFSTVRTHVVPGRPLEAIMELAAKREADLIVVGTTGRTGVARMLLGSTAERLVRNSRVPVLTVH